MKQNFPYWSPSRNKRWAAYWTLRPDFANISLPQDMDMPEIDVFQIYPGTPPEVPEGMQLNYEVEPLLGEDGKYYQQYSLVPLEV